MAYDKTTGIPGSEDADGGLHSCHPATIRIGYLSVTAIRYRPACAMFLSIRPGLCRKIRSYSMGVTKYLIVNSPGHSEKSISESDSFITSAFRSVITTSRSPFNPFYSMRPQGAGFPFSGRLVPALRSLKMFAKLFLAQNGKRYCLACHTGKCSTRHNIPVEVAACAC